MTARRERERERERESCTGNLELWEIRRSKLKGSMGFLSPIRRRRSL
jgi:hypothetical protein